jgi:hypothetical protein
MNTLMTTVSRTSDPKIHTGNRLQLSVSESSRILFGSSNPTKVYPFVVNRSLLRGIWQIRPPAAPDAPASIRAAAASEATHENGHFICGAPLARTGGGAEFATAMLIAEPNFGETFYKM